MTLSRLVFLTIAHTVLIKIFSNIMKKRVFNNFTILQPHYGNKLIKYDDVTL